MGRIRKIHAMDIRDVDLNLLVVFDAMARHRSVNRAAEAVGLSQPATSASPNSRRSRADVRAGSRSVSVADARQAVLI